MLLNYEENIEKLKKLEKYLGRNKQLVEKLKGVVQLDLGVNNNPRQ